METLCGNSHKTDVLVSLQCVASQSVSNLNRNSRGGTDTDRRRKTYTDIDTDTDTDTYTYTDTERNSKSRGKMYIISLYATKLDFGHTDKVGFRPLPKVEYDNRQVHLFDQL